MIDHENGLPVGWNMTLISCVAQVDLGKTPKKVQYCDLSGYKIIKFRDVSYNGINWNKGDKGYIKSDTSIKDLKTLKLNDVLITASAHASEHIGKKVAFVSRIPNDFEEVFFVGELLSIRANSEILLPKFAFYYFLSNEGYKAIQEKVKGVHLTTGEARKIEIPLAPLPEQNRIVAEIEKQFSRLDEAVAGLKRIQVNLKRYRASVLKSAVEGKLTAEWRKQHPDTEPAEQLLQRILKERREHWEQAELEKMQAAGKQPKDELWKHKYKEPEKPDVSDLPEMPEGWVWARLDTIASLKGGITVDKNKVSPDFIKAPYLRVANVQRGYLDLTEIKEILAPKQKIDQLLLKRNDILFNEGGDIDKLGRGWIWEDQLSNCIHQNHVFRARLLLLNVEAKLVSWWGNTFGRDYFLREGKQTTNLASINLTKLSCFPVPLPSQQEQNQIVSEVERRLSIADEVEQQINTNLKRAERLRQAILKKAFSGKLVPQDPDDEPAGVLLEKIKQGQRA